MPVIYDQVLVIGATGMLIGVTEYLARKTRSVSFTARTSNSIANLSKRLEPISNTIGVKLDWNKRTEFLSGISSLYENGKLPDIVVVWLHDDTLGPEVAALVARGQNISFFQVRGSAAAKASIENDLEAPHIEGLNYHEIVLGFHIEKARSRWLTNDEICAGVIDAIENGNRMSVVGTVEPWEMRP